MCLTQKESKNLPEDIVEGLDGCVETEFEPAWCFTKPSVCIDGKIAKTNWIINKKINDQPIEWSYLACEQNIMEGKKKFFFFNIYFNFSLQCFCSLYIPIHTSLKSDIFFCFGTVVLSMTIKHGRAKFDPKYHGNPANYPSPLQQKNFEKNKRG